MNMWRAGYVDALFFRECKCPEPGFIKNAKYVSGYVHGTDVRKKIGIKPLAENNHVSA